jgi:hypothetical protein
MQNARFAAAISRATVQVKPTTFPMMLSYNGNCLLRQTFYRVKCPS